jgi:hypothetical protein
MTKTPPPALPDFELAELRGFDPKALNPNLPMSCFILLLAAVFNDLKGALYVVARLRDARRVADRNLAWRGQLVGMQIQNTRRRARSLSRCVAPSRGLAACFPPKRERMPVHEPGHTEGSTRLYCGCAHAMRGRPRPSRGSVGP